MFRKKIKKVVVFVVAFMAVQIIATSTVMAAKNNTDVSSVTSGIDILKDIALAIVGGIGSIYLAFGISDFATGWNAHESSQQIQGIKKGISGIVMMAVPTLIKLFT